MKASWPSRMRRSRATPARPPRDLLHGWEECAAPPWSCWSSNEQFTVKIKRPLLLITILTQGFAQITRQGLVQILDDVGGGLDTHGQSHQLRLDPARELRFGEGWEWVVVAG